MELGPLPSIQPNSPGVLVQRTGGRRQGTRPFLESPEKECVVGASIDRNIPGVAGGEREIHARQAVGNPVVCSEGEM